MLTPVYVNSIDYNVHVCNPLALKPERKNIVNPQNFVFDCERESSGAKSYQSANQSSNLFLLINTVKFIKSKLIK